MWGSLKKLVHDCLTENDGESYCPFRVGGFALSAGGIPTFLGCVIWTTMKSGHFDAISYGTAFGGMMAGLAALAGGVAFKAKTDAPGGTPPGG